MTYLYSLMWKKYSAVDSCYYDTAGIREMNQYIQTIDITSENLYLSQPSIALQVQPACGLNIKLIFHQFVRLFRASRRQPCGAVITHQTLSPTSRCHCRPPVAAVHHTYSLRLRQEYAAVATRTEHHWERHGKGTEGIATFNNAQLV